MSFPKVKELDHIGIRITDFDRSFAFYKKLGFTNHGLDVDGDHEIWTDSGLYLNLIANANTDDTPNNVLLDEPTKYPGYSHAAFLIDDADAAIAAFKAEGIKITGGPRDVPRRVYFFIRDPDSNVLEFTQTKS